jgi:GntR family trehalose operon transcriptional repressor
MPAQKYVEIYRELKEMIEEGRYPAETCIPTEYALVDRYKCSRNTIRRAIHQLQEIGYVQSIHGKGVVVIYRKDYDRVQQTSDRIESSTAYYSRRNTRTEVQVLELRHYRAGEQETAMGFRKDQRLCFVKRLRLVEGTPDAIECAWFPEEKVKGITTEIAQNSIYEYIGSVLGQKIISSKRQITVEVATEDDLRYLDPSPANCLGVIMSRSFNADGTMIEYSQMRKVPQTFVYSTIARQQKLK